MANEIEKHSNGYMMWVDPAAAIEKNREVIDKIRELWERKTGQKVEPLADDDVDDKK